MARQTNPPPATSSIVNESEYVWRRRPVGPPSRREPVEQPMSYLRGTICPWATGPTIRDPPINQAHTSWRRAHARRCPAGGRASVRRIGLPGHLLLRTDLAFRQSRRLRYLIGSPSLGIAVIADCLRAHSRLTTRALVCFDGTASTSCRQTCCAVSNFDWGTMFRLLGRHEVRNFLVATALVLGSQRVPHRRSAGTRSPSMLVSRLFSPSGQWRLTSTAAGRTRGGTVPAGNQCDCAQTLSRRGDHRRGIHVLAGVTRMTDTGGPGFTPNGTWDGCTTPSVIFLGSGNAASITRTRHSR